MKRASDCNGVGEGKQDPSLHVHPDFHASPTSAMTAAYTRARWEEDMIIWDADADGGERRESVADSLNLTLCTINGRLKVLRTLAAMTPLSRISLADSRTIRIWKLFKRRLTGNSMKIAIAPVRSLAGVLKMDPLELKDNLTQIRDLKHYLHFAGIHRDNSHAKGDVSKNNIIKSTAGYRATQSKQALSAAHSLASTPDANAPLSFQPEEEMKIWRAYLQHHPSNRSTDTNQKLHNRLVELSQQCHCTFAQVRDHLGALINLQLGLTTQHHSAGRPFTNTEDNTLLTALGRNDTHDTHGTQEQNSAPSFGQVFQLSQKLRCTMGAVTARYNQLKTLRLLSSVSEDQE